MGGANTKLLSWFVLDTVNVLYHQLVLVSSIKDVNAFSKYFGTKKKKVSITFIIFVVVAGYSFLGLKLFWVHFPSSLIPWHFWRLQEILDVPQIWPYLMFLHDKIQVMDFWQDYPFQCITSGGTRCQYVSRLIIDYWLLWLFSYGSITPRLLIVLMFSISMFLCYVLHNFFSSIFPFTIYFSKCV